MKVIGWDIEVKLEDGRMARVADMPDEVAQIVDDYLGELESSGHFDLTCPIPLDKLKEITKQIEDKLLYGGGWHKINGGYANADFNETETELANDDRDASEEIILVYNTETGEQDMGDGGRTYTGQIKVTIDAKSFKIKGIGEY